MKTKQPNISNTFAVKTYINTRKDVTFDNLDDRFQVGVDGNAYHRACFKCSFGGCVISPSNYVAHEHQLYCKHHHAQLFMAKGNFSQFDKQHDQDNNSKVVVPNGVTENTAEV